ncbi:DUF6497 family protein [uncultured Aliiroseovarius sp.]|uniref:DUF6497 family protein n=2 Tax=Aliiroseovarius TaxID=1658781 RepID=UPI00259A8E37|nr:DUF6497 family protein [uncultured Aliiroseovarius sp.]
MEKARQYSAVVMGCTGGYQGFGGLTGAAGLAATLAFNAPSAACAANTLVEEGASITVPSGQEITVLDMIEDDEGTFGPTVRFRFLAPRIARDKGDVAFMQAEDDMAALCQDYALPLLTTMGADLPTQIIIVLSDRVVEFGVADPEATQFFEAYRPEDGHCIWEGF